MGHGSSLCAKYHCKQFKNPISKAKIPKKLSLQSSTIHNIVKRFRESSEISVYVGQGRRPLLNECDLWALRWHCMRNHHEILLNTATCAQESFGKLLSRQCQGNASKTMPGLILHILIWFLGTLYHRKDVLDCLSAVQICLFLKMYDPSWKGESDNDDLLARSGKNFTFKTCMLNFQTIKSVVRRKGEVTHWETCLHPNFFGVSCRHQNQNVFIYTKYT